MRKIVLATLAIILASSGADAAGFQTDSQTPVASQPQQSDIIQVQNYNSRSAPSNQNNNRDRRRTDFVCVITPPDSANRSRPYVCPVERGRVGGRCRCSGVVGSGNIDTAW